MSDDFLGGPSRLFEQAGKEQLDVLLEHGLTPKSKVLDIGCGALRGGRWIIPFLDPGNYYGIEPNRAMLERGLRESISSEIVDSKRPHFDYNDEFDFSVFDSKFTHLMARSIWTHSSKAQIELMLDGLAQCGEPDALLLASFLPASRDFVPRPVSRVLSRIGVRADYRGDSWTGRSDKNDEPGMVAHRYSWIKSASESRNLSPAVLPRPPLTRGGQIWAVVRRNSVA